jgi:DNA-3-methyladenine glycosylase II
LSSLRIAPKGPFSLEASTRFLEGFTPAGYEAGASGHLHIAFPVDGSWETVGVCVRQTGASVMVDMFGSEDRATVRAQISRIFSLDVDGSGFAAVGRRDPVVARLQRSFPGLRPVLFWSPYEAAAWTIIGHRIRMAQAAGIKLRMAEERGGSIDVHGERLHAFLAPRQLVGMRTFRGLFGRKIEQLHGVGRAALEGKLDARRLRSVPREDALEELRRLPGIGPFSSELILVRGAGDPDHFPLHERRLQGAMADAYGLDADPPIERLIEIAEAWRPYRSWVSLLLRAELEDPTHEAPG